MLYPATIVFDLDGTLVDTAPDLTASLNHALDRLGRPPVPAEQVRQLVGQGAAKLLERGLSATGGCSPELVDQGLPLFLEWYGAHILDASRPFDGVEAAMEKLADAGCRLAVCTNKRLGMTNLLLDALGWRGRFAAVLGADSLTVRKPDPLHLTETIARAGGDVRDAAFVGDSITDALTARAAGVPLALVTFGYSVEPVAELNADALIDSFGALPAALAGFKARSTRAA